MLEEFYCFNQGCTRYLEPEVLCIDFMACLTWNLLVFGRGLKKLKNPLKR